MYELLCSRAQLGGKLRRFERAPARSMSPRVGLKADLVFAAGLSGGKSMPGIFGLIVPMLTLTSLLGAETWNGRLVDAACAERQKDLVCSPTAATSVFALQLSRKLLKFDSVGNGKAAAAFRSAANSADRSGNPASHNYQVTATVKGTLMGDEIKVDSIEVR